MSNKTEFSRLVFKRSTVPGVIPTVPTGTTIDNTWLSTDLLVGEGFINVEDDKLWYRTNNGIVEVSMSGISSNNYYTEYAYLSGNTLVFDRNDLLDAYSVDLSALIITGATGGDYLPLTVTASTIVDFSDNQLYFTGNSASSITTAVVGGSGNDDTFFTQITDEYALLGTQLNLGIDNYFVTASSDGVSLESNTGSTVSIFKINKSAMRAESTLANFPGITYDIDYSANYTNRSLVDKEYVDSVGGGTFTGGTITGDVTFAGDVIMGELSATTISILN